MVTTSPIGSPCLRSVFLIERADAADGLQLRVQQELCKYELLVVIFPKDILL